MPSPFRSGAASNACKMSFRKTGARRPPPQAGSCPRLEGELDRNLPAWNFPRSIRLNPSIRNFRKVSPVKPIQTRCRQARKRRRPDKAGADAAAKAGAGPDHGGCRRRPVGDRHLLPGRRAIRLRAALDDLSDLAVHDCDPAGERTDRPGDRQGTGRQRGAARTALDRDGAGGAACRRQHLQHRGS